MTNRLSDVSARQKRRLLVDFLAKHAIAIGGISIIIAITLIFFYLTWVVTPLFKGGEILRANTYPVPGDRDAATVHLAIEEQAEIGIRATSAGRILFFDTRTGNIVSEYGISIPPGESISSFSAADPATQLMVFGFSNGTALPVKFAFDVSYPDNKRLLTPKLVYVMGEDPVEIDTQGGTLERIAIQSSEDSISIAALTDQNRLLLSSFEKEDSLFEDEASFVQTNAEMLELPGSVDFLLLNKEQRGLWAINKSGNAVLYDLSSKESPQLVEKTSLSRDGSEITDARYLAGSVSLILAKSNGLVVQWFPTRDEDNILRWTRIREFEVPNRAPTRLVPEFYRKGFVTFDQHGFVGLFHATAQREITVEQISTNILSQAAISPRANMLLVLDSANQIHAWDVHNEHPEISWSSLWGKVWYEGYSEPAYIWQSSSASNDFEPKLSLVPLSFGTLKAAFYAMLLAMPLAILGAIFAAYFMAPKLRQSVKPAIEIMEALPTVILGFLAGLWLAPLVEEHLPAVFALTVFLPVGIVVFAYIWSILPENIRHSVPDGWQPLLLVPVIVVLSWLAFAMSPAIEASMFGGDMPLWLRDTWGIDFDQRNSLIVGLAMGFAVIPTIFSIAEDAIFSVPKHLTNGSLALGATPWQTFVRVVLLTASPGIFSAVMIGFGRAVGETMIVLMATGNTPVMDLSIFQGMRTLSANIAVEMPESEVNSTHFRILFLAALVLFLFTFMFNTLAEIVRQRLRRKYSSL